MTELAPGAEGVLERTVELEHTTRRGEYDIFSTPQMVLLLEEAAIEALAPHLAEGQSSVGTKVEIAHTAATLRGQKVRATATVTEVDRRRVAFSITVVDDVEEIGTGTHERFVIDVPGFEERLAAKADRVG
ncbi:MAG TPA: thioesterase family protein [Nocardioides sp.]|nr:thioesterase family protein [Nocardioides sp.]